MACPPVDEASSMALAAKLHRDAQRNHRPLSRVKAFVSQHLSALQGRSFVFMPEIAGTKQRPFCIFDQRSPILAWWDSFLVIGVIYSTAWTPLAVVFQQARWPGNKEAGTMLDILFTLDVLIRFRTSYRDHGYDVTNPRIIAVHYVRGWFCLDFFSSLPIDHLFHLITQSGEPPASTMSDPIPRVQAITFIEIISLLRVMRIGRLVRKLSALNGANFLRIVYLMYMFILCGHWLGLIWYSIAIRPLEADELYDSFKPWLWTLDDDTAYFAALK